MIIKFKRQKPTVNQWVFDIAGLHYFQCPVNVNSVNVMAIGAGSNGSNGELNPRDQFCGAGGGRAWKNGITVKPGTLIPLQVGGQTDGVSFFASVEEVSAEGGSPTGLGGRVIAGNGGGDGGDASKQMQPFQLVPGGPGDWMQKGKTEHADSPGSGGLLNERGKDGLVIITTNSYFPWL